MKGHTKSKTINRERTAATYPRSHSRSYSSDSGPCRICSSSPCEGNPFMRTLVSLFSLFLPVLSCLLASLLSVKRPWEKKEGEEAVEDECGVGALRISVCETQPAPISWQVKLYNEQLINSVLFVSKALAAHDACTPSRAPTDSSISLPGLTPLYLYLQSKCVVRLFELTCLCRTIISSACLYDRVGVDRF